MGSDFCKKKTLCVNHGIPVSGLTMATALPEFPSFDINCDQTSLSQRWKKWIARFENLLLAMDISEPKRKKALLLHYAGQDVHDIFDTLPEPPADAPPERGSGEESQSTVTGDEYEIAIKKLNIYFNPKRNVEYEAYIFRQAKQQKGETLDFFQSRLRQLAATCEFSNVDREVKSQIVAGCLSSRLRRRALRDPKMTLTGLLDHGRALETSESQASGIEKKVSAVSCSL